MNPAMSPQVRKVLVYGANGVQGGAIARELHAQDFEVRGVVRDAARPRPPGAPDLPLVSADLEKPASLRRASESVDAVVLTIPLEWTRATVLRWARNAVEAARDAGVRLLILNSSARLPAQPSDVPAFELRREVETLLRELGPPSIMLRPPLFMENLTAPWIAGAISRDRTLPYPVAEKVRVSWLAAADLGAYVAAALRRPDLAGSTLDVGGPEALDGPALARALSPAVGTPLHYFTVAPADVARQLAPLLGESVAEGIALNYAWIAKQPDLGLFVGSADELVRGLHRPLLSVAEWAHSVPWAAAAFAQQKAR